MPLPLVHPGGDPFAPTANPFAYVPRVATEYALDRLEERIRAGVDAVTLAGPCGAGKTLLLHILSHRLDGDFHALYIPYPKLAPQELCAWLLAALGARPSRDAEGALHERMVCDMAIGFPPLLLMVDDAASMPADTLACLYDLQEDSVGFLRILFVRSELDRPDAFARHGVRPPEIALEGRMDPGEMARYVRAHLERNPVDASLRVRLEASLPSLHATTEGNPARVHSAMTRILCSAVPRSGRLSSLAGDVPDSQHSRFLHSQIPQGGPPDETL
jgi:type II secretory pathway predicted ATPase ExeA